MNPQQQKSLFFILSFLLTLIPSTYSYANHLDLANNSKGPTTGSRRFSPAENASKGAPRKERIALAQQRAQIAANTRTFADEVLDRKEVYITELQTFADKKVRVKEEISKLESGLSSTRNILVSEARQLALVSRDLLLVDNLNIPAEQVTAAEDLLALSDFMLDTALAVNPLTGMEAALYRSLKGEDLVTGARISDEERAYDFLGVVTLGFMGPRAMSILSSAARFIPKAFTGIAQRVAMRGLDRFKATPQFAQRVRRCFGLGEEWVYKTTKAKRAEPGFIFQQRGNPHHSIRIMPGNPRSPHVVSQRPYVVHKHDGNYLDRLGQVTTKQEE